LGLRSSPESLAAAQKKTELQGKNQPINEHI
jgi:hypothetical protein